MKNKKEKIIAILLVVGLIVVTGAISYAAFKFSQMGSKVNAITSGSVVMSYTESSNVISLEGALPTTDDTGTKRLNNGEYFDFTVSSNITGKININYEIAAEELEGNTIDGKYIKYYLTRLTEEGTEEKVFGPVTYKADTVANRYTGRPANMMSLYTSSMAATETIKFRLRMYVDESYNPQGDGGNLTYQARVNVYGLAGDKIEQEPVALAAGTYDSDGNLLQTWDELGIDIETNTTSSNVNWDSNVAKVIIPDGVSKIGQYRFNGASNIKEIIIPNSVTNIRASAFQNCTGLTSINIPNSVTTIEPSAFSNCTGLTSVNIGNSVTSIGSGAFQGCTGLTSIDIPNSVTSISSGAFYGCTGLTSITIPNSVTSIGSSVFGGCTNLTTIYYSGTATGAPWGATNATVIAE